MRRRWDVSEDFWLGMLYAWMFAWIPIFVGITAIWGARGLSGGIPVGGAIFLGAWFGVPGVPMLLWFLWWCLSALWSERPRRVWEPVTEDLREQDEASK